MVAQTEPDAALTECARDLVDALAASVPCVVLYCSARNPIGSLQAAVLDALSARHDQRRACARSVSVTPRSSPPSLPLPGTR